MYAIHAPTSVDAKWFVYKSRITGEVTEFYAENGIVRIHCENRGAEDYVRASVSEFLHRARAMGDTVRKLRSQACRAGSEAQRKRFHQEAVDHQRLVEVMVAAAQAAKHQGDPFDPRVRKTPTSRQFGFRGAAPRPFCTGVTPMPKAPPTAQVKEVGGVVLSPSQVIVRPK